MKRNFLFPIRILMTALTVGAQVFSTLAQSATERSVGEVSDGGWWFSVMLIVLVGLGGAFFFWRKSKKGIDQPQYNYGNRYSDYYRNESYEMDGLDADKELEWLRKAKKASGKSAKPQPTQSTEPASGAGIYKVSPSNPPIDIDTKAFQEKMRKLQYSQLPINSFGDLTKAKLYEPLPASNDKSLLNAIEQAGEEFEEDEAVRELAVKILTAFRTRNSVDALTQIALYDLSSNLRSKAVSTLTDFDHASVFEPILLSCADPTREVRAAAARGLFRLSFNRADAWKRIIETNDEFRMSHAARAAIESGFAYKSFDRLIHEDLKVAYEAFTLVALLVKSGETEGIFDAIATHKDERVKFALLHVLKVQKDYRTLAKLNRLRGEVNLPVDVAERVRTTVLDFELAAA